jgi:hypothetical protein
MKEIEFEIIDTKLENLGIEQQSEYTTLKFRESALHAYWICHSVEDPNELIIKVYIATDCFLCKYTKENIELLNSILNESCCHNNNV